ncbi:ergothioneine biosynthesis protein EgtB [Adhaeribacter soli]|uniref:Ergothioneine biosynthesis protein EgtB n=1 Tax=Adhaeribacter soli TaxID=2607655 RepID=A0A5N1J5Q2_9BACT|nr:ergothioneine biosynthesis protein EgtB [Adhaeribacter soli]KAA9346034.1 ergothioneine biosynthesis protein EgtB [Adhaeribacter soli]
MLLPAETATPTLTARFSGIRAQTEDLCRPLLPEDTVVQPIVDVSPPKWHLAHTSWFFETFVLQQYQPGYRVFHPKYNFLFNSYYNSIGSRVLRNQRGTLSRPGLDEIYRYRAYVNEHMQEFLATAPEKNLAEAAPVIELGLQHEQQHQELLVTDIKYILSTNPLLPAYLPEKPKTVASAPRNPDMLQVKGGVYEIGYKGQGFCFDNELGVHQVYVDDFRIRNQLVTNGEFLQFMQDSGYQDFRHWLGEGFELATQEQWQAPLYWLKTDDVWQHFTMHGLQEIDLNAPVTHLSFYEANAFANWAGKRLLTEFEWEIACREFVPEVKKGNFLESQNFAPLPADNDETCSHLLGNLWEWTYSSYHPYPGFSKAPGALGEYNGKFMINQMVLRGGSCATPASHIRATYRNFFHPDKRWQFSGIRLAE